MAIQWGKHEFHHFQVLTTNGKPLKNNAMKYQGLHFVTVLPGRNGGRQAGSLLTPEGYEEGRGRGRRVGSFDAKDGWEFSCRRPHLAGGLAVPMTFPDLANLLEARIAVIADHEFRDRDPEAHLEALKSVSEAISAWHETHRDEIDGNLEHFLAGASYQKALLYLEAGTRRPCGE